MAEQKQDGRRPKKGGDKKKKEQTPPKHKTNWTLERKKVNVQRHLARDAKRAERANRSDRKSRGRARYLRRNGMFLPQEESTA